MTGNVESFNLNPYVFENNPVLTDGVYSTTSAPKPEAPTPAPVAKSPAITDAPKPTTPAPTQTASAFVMRKFRGSVDNPAPVLSGDVLGTVTAVGYGAPAGPYNTAGLPGSAQNWIRWVATEDHSLTAHGANLYFNLIPNGSLIAQTVLQMSASGCQPGLQLLQTGSGIKFTDNSIKMVIEKYI